jgi:hypothetical protein
MEGGLLFRGPLCIKHADKSAKQSATSYRLFSRRLCWTAVVENDSFKKYASCFAQYYGALV